MTVDKPLLRAIAQAWSKHHSWGDMPLAAQAARSFDESGGFAGWDTAGRRRWHMPSGRRTTRRRKALEAWSFAR